LTSAAASFGSTSGGASAIRLVCVLSMGFILAAVRAR
jgi:hypothetical protein